MGKLTLLCAIGFALFMNIDAFYQYKGNKNAQVVTPKTLEELKKALCGNEKGGVCEDKTHKKIIINKVFDFTGSEGTKTETGCYHNAQCKEIGQMKLNVNNQCMGLTPAKVTFSTAGQRGMLVGSNKIIIGQNGGGLKGKGLKLNKSHNVEIRNLKITDINAHVIWGGDAIDLINANNVLIDGCYLKNIGRQMIVSHYGPSTGVTISNSVFDGNTKHSSTCNGAHYWVFLFLGQGDKITMQNNVILNTSGRSPKVHANNNQKNLLHMIQNIFYNVKGNSLELGDKKSSVIMEGNIYVNVQRVVDKPEGNIFMPQNAADQQKCQAYLGRQCLLNTVVNSKEAHVANKLTALEDFKKEIKHLTKPIAMKKAITKLVDLPDEVEKYIK